MKTENETWRHRAVKGVIAAAAWAVSLLMLASCASDSGPRANNPAHAGPSGSEASAPPPVNYHIGPGDMLQIVVYNQSDLSVTVPVRPDGKISMPLVESIEASGKTPSELGLAIQEKLSEYVRSPQVNVIVTHFEGTYADQIRVVGQVSHPQALPYRNGMKVLDAMIQVGGLGQFAAGNRARIERPQPGNEKPLQIRVRLDDLLNKGDLKQNVELLPGDVIFIPETRF
jgi:polysaccharide biosynthesis/export protein